MQALDALPPVSAATLAAFRSASPAIIAQVVARSLAQENKVTHHGENAEQLITAGIQFTSRMLEAALAVGEVALLEDQLTWAMDRLPHDDVAPEHVLNRFRIYREVVQERLPAEQAAEIIPYVDWMITRQQELMQ